MSDAGNVLKFYSTAFFQIPLKALLWHLCCPASILHIEILAIESLPFHLQCTLPARLLLPLITWYDFLALHVSTNFSLHAI